MLMIVSREDFPVYDLHIDTLVRRETAKEKYHLYELVLHAALDPIDSLQWTTNNMFLKQVDKFDQLSIHCLIMPSNAKLLLLHEDQNEEKIKMFFNEVYDLFVKAIMNPFYDPKEKINVE